jgi:hypothetical protein
MSEPHSIPQQKCPFCGYRMDRSSGIKDAKPKVGDISLCLKCMELSLFSEGFVLRQPTAKELIDIQRSTAWDRIEMVRRAHRYLKIKEKIVGEGR